jgi:hypothetical protein
MAAMAGGWKSARVRSASRTYTGTFRIAATPDPASRGSRSSSGCPTGRCRRPYRDCKCGWRRARSGWRIAARVATLGFTDVRAYLADRVLERGWLLAEVAAELAAHRLTVRRLLDRHGIRRVRRTPAERAASQAGLRVQSVSWQARRAARLAEFGFADLATYLQTRHGVQGWSVKRMRAELGVGRRWLVGELVRLGLRP